MKDLTKIKKLEVYDFDGTLVNTPLPDAGKTEYYNKTGKEWPHKGWWGQPDSLNMDVFNIKTNPDVISDYKKGFNNPETGVIMLTGRIKELKTYVENILTSLGLKFDGYFYSTGGRTEDAKVNTLNTLLNNYPNIEEVEMWEDRVSHIAIFEQWGKEKCLAGQIKDFKINLVPSYNHK